jgi:putative PEP-CTERM system TPR-repeat lipoprotein
LKRPPAYLRITLAALVVTALFAGCTAEDPDSLIASGKAYLAKNDSGAAAIQFKNALQKNPKLGEARFLLGKALLEAGDAQGAELELRRALELKYAPDLAIPLLAEALLANGQARKLVDEFSRTELPGQAKANLNTTLSLAYQALGNAEASKAALAAALAAQPDYAPALIVVARGKAADRDISGSLATVDQVLEKASANHEALVLKGSLLALAGDHDGAVEFYRKALQSRPNFIPAHSAIISTLMQKGAVEEAAEQLDALKKVAPNHPQTIYLQGQLAYQRKEYRTVRDLAQQLLKAAPNNPAALQLAGAAEYQLGSYYQAESYLNKALQQAPDLRFARGLLIANYLRAGQPAKALATLQPVLGKMDEDADFLVLVGEVYLQAGDPKKAEEYLHRASKLDPNDLTKRTAVAVAHMAQGRVIEAASEFEQISRVDDGITADQALIASHLQRNELDSALSAIDALQKKQPDDPATYSLQGRVLLAKKDGAGARRSFEKAVAVNPTYFPAVASLASMDMAEGNSERARKRFEEVLAADPKNMPALLSLAKLTTATGGTNADSLAFIKKSISANPDAVAPRLALVDYYMANDEPKKADSAAQEALAAIPGKPELLDAAGRAEVRAGEVNKALATYGKLASLQPSSPLPYLRMADIHLSSKNTEEAVKNLRKVLEIRPNLFEAQRKLVQILLADGKTIDALTIAREIEGQRPNEAVGYILEGDIHAAEKRWSDAAVAYRNGVRQAPTSELAIKLHKALLSAGKTAEADKAASSWLRDHPKDVAFRLYSGDLATARKDYSAAAQYYRAAVDLQPENALALNNLAWVSGQMKSAKALEYAERANRLAPNQPAFMDTQAVLMAEQGDTAGATALLLKALEIAPQAAAVRLNLAKVLILAGRRDEARVELEALAKLGNKFPEQAEVKRLQGTL